MSFAAHLRLTGFWMEVGAWPANPDTLDKADKPQAADAAHLRGRSDAAALALEAIPDGVLVLDNRGRVAACNAKYLEYYPHLTKTLVAGEPVQSLFMADAGYRRDRGQSIDPVEWAERRMRAVLVTPESFLDKPTPDLVLQVNATHSEDGSVVVIARDVGTLHTIEAEPLQVDSFLQDTLESIDHGIARFDDSYRLTLWNEQYVSLTEMSPAMAVAGLPLMDVILHLASRGSFGEGDTTELAAQYFEDCTTNLPKVFERNGSEGRRMEVRATHGAKGGLMICVLDITDRVRQARALAESEERYALAAAGSNDGLWDWDLLKQSIYFSTRWKRMLGFNEAEIGDNPEELFSRIHPFDVQEVTTRLDAHLSNTRGHFECEYRVLHQDGTYRWMRIRGVAVRDESGEPLRIAGSQSDVTERRKAEEQMMHDALHDALTGLANRSLFQERIDQALLRLKRGVGTPFAVVYLDLDRFKVVNDSMGHGRGDELLIAVARRLEGMVNKSDTVARLGGDEFGVLLDSATEREAGETFINMLQEALREPFMIGEKPYVTTASVGLAMAVPQYDNAESMLRDADIAMYSAKASGKAGMSVFHPSMHADAVKVLDMERDLRQALTRKEMQLYYQPIVTLGDFSVSGMEALIRWEHPESGVLSPSDFVPLAEETGLIIPIGEWVLRTGTGQVSKWNEGRAPDQRLSLAVNFSVRQLSSLEVAEKVIDWLEEIEFDPSLLKVEITESVLMDSPQRTTHLLNKLKQSRIQISIDDFGTGYSSLSYLRTFPIDTLKVDKSFVNTITEDRDSLEIVRTIVSLARSLRISVIAEGIETDEQAALLRELGVEFGQGFLFARPLDAEAMEAWLLSRGC